MAEDGFQSEASLSPESPFVGDSGTRSLESIGIAKPTSSFFRLQIYLLVMLGLCGAWIVMLRLCHYTGLNPLLVGIVLGILTFLTCRSFAVDRFLTIQPAPRRAPQQVDTIREIISTVVMVLVPILLLKAFVADMFQIPTGSMAETLYGYQKIVQCPNCGRRFPVNVSEEMQRSTTPITRCACDNCLKRLQFASAGPVPDNTFAEAKDAANLSGDRIVVTRFLYDLFNRDPDRLDVVVFKFPGESKPWSTGFDRPFPASGPYSQGTQINYIKRVIGLPGEAIAIQRGKLYALPAGHGISFHDVPANLAPALQEARMRELWYYEYMHEVNDNETGQDGAAYERLWKDPRHPFRIIRKSPDKILAMRRLVYDQDCVPRDQGQPGGTPVRWIGWTAANKGFTSAQTGANHTDWLRYSHLLRPENGSDTVERELITDFLSYNNGVHGNEIPNTRGSNWVGDLILETEVDVARAEGELILELSRGGDRFQARFDLTNGTCKLVRLRTVKNGVETLPLGTPVVTSVKKPGTFLLRFANVDQRLTVWVDNQLPFGDGQPDDVDPYQGGPVVENDLQPASIGVVNAHVTARSIKLFRDTYYTATSNLSDVPVNKWTESSAKEWKATLQGPMPILFMYVQQGHFLCLGDNSGHSSDSRRWGLVPRRLMVGRALLICAPFYPFTPVSRIGRIE